VEQDAQTMVTVVDEEPGSKDHGADDPGDEARVRHHREPPNSGQVHHCAKTDDDESGDDGGCGVIGVAEELGGTTVAFLIRYFSEWSSKYPGRLIGTRKYLL
jgi:hypothetical protein